MNDIQLYENNKINIIKNMYFKGLDDDNLQIFLHACKRTNLDPFMRQIYPVMRNDYKTNKSVLTIQTGIDGYRLIAERTGKYSPGREAVFSYTPEGRILSCTAYVKKMTDDKSWHEVAATAFFDEYCQRTKDGKPTQFWLKMGHTMISKCAEALALRKAFPADLSGIYTKEEMEQAEVENTVIGTAQTSPQALQIEELKQDQEKDENRMLNEFIAQYPEEVIENIETYLAVLRDNWKKPLSYVIERCRNHEKFMVGFTNWKMKNNRQETRVA